MALMHPSQSLWDFALAFYAQPQVAETCVYLQDHHQVNVCLLIGLRWLDESEESLSEAQLADLRLHIQAWSQQLVEPLRKLRRLLKQPVESYQRDDLQEQLRSMIKQAELLAEKKLLNEIESWLAKTPLIKSAHSNLENYRLQLGIEKTFIDILQRTSDEY